MPDDVVPPAHLWIPERVGSYGAEAADLAAMAGRPLDAEQRIAVDAILSYGPGGRWVALEAAVVMPRQNGKTSGVILPAVLADLFLFSADRIVWTAHLFRTARDAFSDVVSLIDGCHDLARRVKKVTYANGEEAIELHSGARLEFLARSKGGGRGLGGKRLVMDEALYLSAESMGSLIPTLSAREDPQIVYGSSAGVLGSDHLRSLRDRGRRGGDPSLVWVEWCAPGGWDDPPCTSGKDCPHTLDADGCALDDEALWRLANPALGRRIKYEFVRAERRAMPPGEFGRERLGWFDLPPTVDQPIPIEAWSALAIAPPDREAMLPIAIGVDVTPERSHASIGVCGVVDGLRVVEVAEHRRGLGWVVPWLVERHQTWRPCAVVIAKGSPAGALIPDLEAAGIEVLKPSTADEAQACGAFVDAAAPAEGEPTLRHLGQPVLDAAVKGAAKVQLGDGAWRWSRRTSTVDISPLVAVTLAAWGRVSRPPAAPSVPLVAWR